MAGRLVRCSMPLPGAKHASHMDHVNSVIAIIQINAFTVRQVTRSCQHRKREREREREREIKRGYQGVTRTLSSGGNLT